MQHFPVFLDLRGRSVLVAGGGQAAVAKLRLLLKTDAAIVVFAVAPEPQIADWAATGRLKLVERPLAPGDVAGSSLVYGASEDAGEDARVAAIARAEGALVNIVDDLDASDFITPAIVDRDPVTVAIGTEGAAPVLARAVKADIEARLSPLTGTLARIGKEFRTMAEALPHGSPRRDFWAEYYDVAGPRAFAEGGEGGVRAALAALLDRHLSAAPRQGHVDFVGAGPGDPELLTLKARNALDRADVVIHDRLVPGAILELARREALIIEAGKQGFGPSTPQAEIDAMIVAHASRGLQVVRLKSGDPGVFGRLDEEIDAVTEAGLSYAIVPGITAAVAAAASLRQSLTKRGRNSDVRLVTGHDMEGYAEHDWRALARPGAVAAIYMGQKAARFLQGRLMMHGADPATPVTVIENVSRPDERIVATNLGRLVADLSSAGHKGAAITIVGLAPRAALALTDQLEEAVQ
jgi:uroporphyrin-III C-methyltransferase/precorrin-2 dehydrogenase/sirohydrochlorin ferrochelatase